VTAPVATRRPGIDPRIGARRTAVTRQRGRRRLRLVVAAVSVAVLLLCALVVLHTPLLAARHVTVRGAHHVSARLVVRTAGLSGAPPLIDVDAGAAAARLEALPWLARATVSRHWPDSVVVTVVERSPVVALARPAPASGYALVDAGGRVLQWVGAAPPGLPVLQAPVAVPKPGRSLSAAARPGLVVADAAERTLPGRLQGVSVDPSGTVRLDLGGGVHVLVGRALSLGPKLASLRSVLAGAPPPGPEVIDVTVPGEPTVGPASP
jgi:cell division protein FtsQ